MSLDPAMNPFRTRNTDGDGSPTLAFPRDQRRHPDAAVEWWYLFGFLDDRYTIVACFWCYHERSSAADGLAAAYALTEVGGPGRWQGTFVDCRLFQLTREKLKRLLRDRPDPFLEAVLEVTDAGELFAPYRPARDAHWDSSVARPIDIRVGPCHLRHEAEAQMLHLSVDDGKVSLDLTLDASRGPFPMGGTGSFDFDGQRMWGYTYPQAATSGSVGIGTPPHEVTGRVWLDHQWGDWDFENPTERYYHPEWHYFGILLDDGRSLNIFRGQRPGRNGREAYEADGLNPVLCEPGRTLRLLDRPTIVPRERIESLRTNNLYEYGWSIELPDVEGALELVPFHPNHELFVFSPQRGVLELGCRVTGRLEGRPCRGVGFVETFGETLDINTFFWGQRKTNLARQLEKFMPRRFDPAWLRRICGAARSLAVDPAAVEHAIIDPIWSMMDRGGKGWRSAWLTTCCHALGHDGLDDHLRDLLPIIEMLHTGSLVIDDIQDGSPTRRNKPALHTQIGTDLAINVGNLLYFLPLIIIQEAIWLTEAQRAAIYAVVANAFRQGHVGQAMDLMWSKGRYDLEAKVAAFSETREELLEQYGLKSGCQLEAAARIAGIITGAPDPLVTALAEYSRVFGIVFQIVDDLIDVQEGRAKLGKAEGEDVRNGKLNMVLLYALAAATEPQRAALIRAMRVVDGDEGFLLAREVIRRTQAVDRCIADAEAMIERAWTQITPLPPTDAKIVMRSTPRWLLQQRRLAQQARRRRSPSDDTARTAPPRTRE